MIAVTLGLLALAAVLVALIMEYERREELRQQESRRVWLEEIEKEWRKL